jgi:hypothetical protein
LAGQEAETHKNPHGRRERTAVEFTLSGGNAHDAPQGRLLLETIGTRKYKRNYQLMPLLVDRVYEDDYTQYIARRLYFEPVVPEEKSQRALGIRQGTL